jgi:NADH-quinone oxidoreductase subunit F
MTYEEMLNRARREWEALQDSRIPVIRVGAATCGRSAGARPVLRALQEDLAMAGIDAHLLEVGCVGLCFAEPLVTITKPARPGVVYGHVTPQKVSDLVDSYLVRDDPVAEWAMGTVGDGSIDGIPRLFDTPVLKPQVRRVLRNCGSIDPTNIEHYVAGGGYGGFTKALHRTREQIIAELRQSGLRGRGGAGFPTWRKWQFCIDAPGNEKYVICNADEGDPGAFMNRSLLEGDPHSVLEGMLIAGYVIGASRGFVYCRAEYPLALERLRIAIGQMEQHGLLGEDILGSGFNFGIEIKQGAGAFVCGEETALIASIEGKRGMPAPRPPFPAVSGLFRKPTVINNVESLASVAMILQFGADWFAQCGTEKSKGTKTFALVGKVKRTGLVEVPLGISLREIVYGIGDGTLSGRPFKAVQTGGPSGGCLPVGLLESPVDYESLSAAGSIIGSGGMVVMDRDNCMVDVARFFLDFTQKESCGECVPCRLGTRQMLDILNDITNGSGKPGDIELLVELGTAVKRGSLCGLGQTTPNPVLTTIRYFRDEYEAHIVDKHCAAGACKALVEARCSNACPAGVDVPTYVALTAQGRYAEALEVHRSRNPFALVCGRVCPAFCEQRCRRGDLDDPIAIRAIKRFMADREAEHPWTPQTGPERGQKVAVIGSGPAGLTAALRLREMGYGVTVFEALPVAGGMMAVGIPEYRLPRQALNREIQSVVRAGAELRLNTALGRDITLDELLTRDGYQAVVLAIGASLSRKLGIAGEDAAGVYHGVYFLRDVALGQAPDLKRKTVVVVGGGNVAIDAARTALRARAAEVNILYRRARTDMPANVEEVRAAEAEGCIIHPLTNPVEAIVEGRRIVAVRCQAQTLGDFDGSGRQRPVPVAGSEFNMACDVLVPAIGQQTDLSWLTGDGISIARDGTFVVNRSLATTRPGVFAAGDNTTGPSTVIGAVAQGNKVAVAVDVYLRIGKWVNPVWEPEYRFEEQLFNIEDYGEAKRPVMPETAVAERVKTWEEVELGFDERTAREECKRCLRCDLEWLQTMDGRRKPIAEMFPVEAPQVPVRT